jgi:mannose-1-phosphate guanylyltransferase/phosphomannomutase
MKAVIMAGGEGTRLRPLTSQRPKPLAPALNLPIMEHIVLLLKQHGITDIVVTLHYLADNIEGYFGDGSEWGVNMVYSVEDTPLGTAGSVKQAEEHLKDDTFLIISGDALTDINLDKAIAYHRAKQSLATIVLSHVPNPLEFGVVITDDEGHIRRFLEKPSWGEVFSDTVNTGMYILEPSIFSYMEMGKNYDWSHDIFPQILSEGKPLFGYIMDNDYWCDVGNLQQYREAQYTVLDGQTRVRIGSGGSEGRNNGVWVGEGCYIDHTAQILPPVVIGRNCKVKADAIVGPYSVIGDNSIIEEKAKVHRSILWDNVYVGWESQLSACTVCSHATIKANCLVQEGAVVGARCRIEDGTTIRTQIKLWPDKIIEAGSIVTMSLIWGQKWAGSLFRKQGVMGIANIEMNPDFACKLGASFGGYLKRGATVVISRDSGPVARMLKRAMMSGLLSVGVNVLDMRSMPLPISRHGILGSQASGGVHIRLAPNDPKMMLIEFFDGQGVYLSKGAERKVETIFFREDFRRVDADQVGTLEFAGRSVEQYSEDFYHHIRIDDVKSRHLKVVADFAFGRLGNVYPQMLGRMGVELIALNAYAEVNKTPKTQEARAALLPNLAQIVQTLQADLGVLFEADGERMTLVDENGKVIEGNDLLAMMSVLVSRTRRNARIAVPVTAPRMIESITGIHNASVTRTKTEVRDLMEFCTGSADRAGRVDFAGDDSGGFIFSEFQPSFDAMFAFGKMLEMLAATDLRISELSAELPAAHVARAHVRCPWEIKGRVMRVLTREADQIAGSNDGDHIELIDGIKFFRGANWALVLPDASEPYFHVYAEADSEEEANNLVCQYVDKIETLRG